MTDRPSREPSLDRLTIVLPDNEKHNVRDCRRWARANLERPMKCAGVRVRFSEPNLTYSTVQFAYTFETVEDYVLFRLRWL
jgi:hypothetical protein